jgi:hypothetical protein
MRQIVLAVLFAVAGCAAQGVPIDESGGSAGASGGNGSRADMAKPLGGDGARCTTACDCQAGLACRQGMCGMSNLGAIYCCDRGDCPAGSFCQSTSGGFAQCGSPTGGGGGPGGSGGGPGGGSGGAGGGPGGGISDLGVGMFCQQIPCANNGTVCKQIGCGACTAAGTCGQN